MHDHQPPAPRPCRRRTAYGVAGRPRPAPARPGRDRLVPEGEREASATDTLPDGRGQHASPSSWPRSCPTTRARSRSCCGPPSRELDRRSRTAPAASHSSRRPAAGCPQGGQRAGPAAGRRRGRHRGLHGRPGDLDVQHRQHRQGRGPPRRSCATTRPTASTVQVTGPAGIQADIGQVFDGANTAPAAGDRRRGRAAADHHLPQPGPLAGAARRRRHRRPPRRRSSPPTSSRSPAWPGTSRPSASSACWSSAPAPTTPCC